MHPLAAARRAGSSAAAGLPASRFIVASIAARSTAYPSTPGSTPTACPGVPMAAVRSHRVHPSSRASGQRCVSLPGSGDVMFVVLEVLGIGALAAKGASGEFVKRLFLEPCRTLWEDLADDDRDGVLVCACGLALPGTMTLRLTAAFRLPGFGSANGRTRNWGFASARRTRNQARARRPTWH